IRARNVTGVQTCALPILDDQRCEAPTRAGRHREVGGRQPPGRRGRVSPSDRAPHRPWPRTREGGNVMTQDAIDRAAHRLMRLRRSPHRDLATAIHRMIERRTDDPLANIPVITTSELVALLDEDDPQLALTYHPPLPVREPDWIDQAMAASVRISEHPLNTPARRRLASAALRRTP